MDNTLLKFCSLLVRGSVIDLSEMDINFIKSVYNNLGQYTSFEEIKKKKILPFAAATLSKYEIDPNFWSSILCNFRTRNLKLVQFLDIAYAALRQHGVRKMFVSENFGALLLSEKDIALFASGDIDNHASKDEKENIYAAMESLGCKIKDRYAINNLIAAEFFPPNEFELPDEFYLSVDFYPLARLKLPCFIDSDAFVDWERIKNFKNTNIKLAPVEALTYICLLHTSLHSFHRAPDTRLYLDLFNMDSLGPDYKLISKWCHDDKTCNRAAVAGYLSNKLMLTNISDIITKAGRKTSRIIDLVFDNGSGCLKGEPSMLDVMKIDILCDDIGKIHGVKEILSPDKKWMKDTYGSSGILAHLRHFKHIF